MIYAQVKDGFVVNTIVLDDETLIPLFLEGFDYLIEITLTPGNPSIGWSYDPNTETFSPPQEDEGQ